MLKLENCRVHGLLTYESAFVRSFVSFEGPEAYEIMKSLLFQEINNTPVQDFMGNKITLVIDNFWNDTIFGLQYWDGKLNFGELIKLNFDLANSGNDYRIIPARNKSKEEFKSLLTKI